MELHFGDHESFADDQFCLRILSVLSQQLGWRGIRDAPKIITGRFKEGIVKVVFELAFKCVGY